MQFRVILGRLKSASRVSQSNVACQQRNPSIIDWSAAYTGHTMFISIIEASLGITAACLPMLRPIFSRTNTLLSRHFHSRSGSDNTTCAPNRFRPDTYYKQDLLEDCTLRRPLDAWHLPETGTVSGLSTFISSNTLEHGGGDEVPMHNIKV